MAAFLHTTIPYHTGSEDPSLFWELTICQSLARESSPCQAALERPAPYGSLVARCLQERAGLAPSWAVVEVGGGYGALMEGLLAELPLNDVLMVDISPFFLAEQGKLLGGRPGIRFESADARAFFTGQDREVDLVISNENLGDLPQVVGIPREALRRALDSGGAEGPLGEVAEVVGRYGLDLADAPESFAFNLGPIRYLEALAPVARNVFLSEHGADTVVPPPWNEFLSPTPGDGWPRRIPLKGHDEYTIRFGDLELVARALGYRVRRFHMAELVGLRSDSGLRCMAAAGTHATETAEAVHEFCAHVADYQCMLLDRDG